MNEVREEIELREGTGLLDVQGDESEAALVVRGDAVSLHWSDGAGSIGQRLLRLRDPRGERGELKALAYVATRGIKREQSLVGQVWPLLSLFADGSYRLRFVEGAEDTEVLWGPTRSRATEDFYPYGFPLISTTPFDELDPAAVDKFTKAISEGSTPTAFVATHRQGYAYFVIDGHHKLRGYEEAKRKPNLLIIERRDPVPISGDCMARAMSPS